jgi:hypothetical protein
MTVCSPNVHLTWWYRSSLVTQCWTESYTKVTGRKDFPSSLFLTFNSNAFQNRIVQCWKPGISHYLLQQVLMPSVSREEYLEPDVIIRQRPVNLKNPVLKIVSISYSNLIAFYLFLFACFLNVFYFITLFTVILIWIPFILLVRIIIIYIYIYILYGMFGLIVVDVLWGKR